jgi:uncharacterized protein YndB with AHSA1/START domain
MANNKQIRISKDPVGKKVMIQRYFDAPLEIVWRTWTESKFLDQWWAPKPWEAKTKNMQFKKGGSWMYAMAGPNGEELWPLVKFTSIVQHTSFEYISSFCDKDGIENPDMPVMQWKNVFVSEGEGTQVNVEISFEKQADFEKIVAMGFENGFGAALSNLDQLLEHQTTH